MIIWGVLLVLAGFALLERVVVGTLVHDLRRRRELLRAARLPRQQPVSALGADRPHAQHHRALRTDRALGARARPRRHRRARGQRPTCGGRRALRRAAASANPGDRPALCVLPTPVLPTRSLTPMSAFHHTVQTVTPFHDRSQSQPPAQDRALARRHRRRARDLPPRPDSTCSTGSRAYGTR